MECFRLPEHLTGFFIFVIVFLLIWTSDAHSAERWYNHYKNGLNLIKEEKFAQAILEFEMATEGVYEDQPKKIQTYGMHFIRYYPHREIGIAAYHIGDYSRARYELELSIVYAPSDRAREYLDKLAGVKTQPMRESRSHIPEGMSLTIDQRREVQRKLAHLGLYSGTIDGILGTGSKRAISEFQKRNELPSTGIVNEKTYAKLENVEVPVERHARVESQEQRSSEPKPPAPHSIEPPATMDYSTIRRVGPRLTLAVLPMSDKGGAGQLSEIIADKLVTSLVGFQRYRIIERSQMDKVLKEQKFGLSDLVDPSSAAKLGRLAGVDCLVIGSAWVSNAIMDLNTRLVDTETGEVLATRAGHCSSSNPIEMRTIADEIATYYANALPLAEGSVVKTDPDGTVFIDVGSDYGMRKGMKLVVFEEGETITHPVSGDVIGSRRSKKAEIVLTEIMQKLSIARFVEGEEGTVAVHDPVVTK